MNNTKNNMEKKDKPRLAEVLGVEVGQKWRVMCPEEGIDSVEVWLNEEGHLIGVVDVVGSMILCTAINHPESIIRAPRLTEAELAICKAVGAKWMTRPISIGFGFDFKVFLWKEKPQYLAGDNVEQSWVAAISTEIFKSVFPGDCICVEEAGGDA